MMSKDPPAVGVVPDDPLLEAVAPVGVVVPLEPRLVPEVPSSSAPSSPSSAAPEEDPTTVLRPRDVVLVVVVSAQATKSAAPKTIAMLSRT
jgi:hypothetical protein